MLIDNGFRKAKEAFRIEVNVFRIIFLSVVLLGVFPNVEKFDAAIADFWKDLCLVSYAFKHDSFEPCLAVICFAADIAFWMCCDFYGPVYLHRYRIQRDDSLAAWKGREIALREETLWYIAPWIVFDSFFPRRKLPSYAPTLYELIRDVILCMILYDFFFFLGHYFMHRYKPYYSKYHAKHHTSRTIRAPDAIRHTLVDGTFDVMCSVVALNLVRAHPLSRSVFNIVVIWLITEAHSGMNFPWGLHNILPCIAGPLVHDIHHTKGTVNFQKFFKYLDWLFGTLESEPSTAGSVVYS